MIISVTQEYTRKVFVVDQEQFNRHYLVVESLSEFPLTWVFWGYVYKLKIWQGQMVMLDSKRLKMDMPLLIQDWVSSENWYLGLRPMRWLWRDRRIFEQADPVDVSVSKYPIEDVA
jgi:hypothetical protein